MLVHLCTNNNPTILDVDWLNDASVVIDNTPAGWSFVGSSSSYYDDITYLYNTNYNNYSNIANLTNSTDFNMTISAPWSSNTSATKYLNFNQVNLDYGAVSTGYTGGARNIMFTTCSFANTTTIVDRTHLMIQPAGNGLGELSQVGAMPVGVSTKTFHLLATNTHVTLIDEGVGFMSLWESQGSEYHNLNNTPPVACVVASNTLYMCADTGNTWMSAASLTTQGRLSLATTSYGAPFASTTGIYDSRLSSYKGASSLVNINYNSAATTSKFSSTNVPSLVPMFADPYRRTRLTNQRVRAQIVPITYNPGYGYPTQIVTGTSPVYYTSASIGITGESLDINGEEYYWFNAGDIGLAIKSS
jgi:hypothetical protein